MTLRRPVIAFVAAATTALAIAPVALLLVTSFARQWFWPNVAPAEWSLRAWNYVFSGASGIGHATVQSLGIALGVTVLAVSIATPAARALAFVRFRGRQAVLFTLLLPVLAPPLASAMGIHSIFLRLGLTDSIAGVMIVHLVPAIPYTTLVLMGSFLRFDRDYEAQARTLGATPFAVWWHVTMPAIMPGFAVAASFAFLISWSQYLLTLLIGGGRVLTLPLHVVGLQRGGDEALSAALSIVFLIPALVAFGVASRSMRDHA